MNNSDKRYRCKAIIKSLSSPEGHECNGVYVAFSAFKGHFLMYHLVDCYEVQDISKQEEQYGKEQVD